MARTIHNRVGLTLDFYGNIIPTGSRCIESYGWWLRYRPVFSSIGNVARDNDGLAYTFFRTEEGLAND